MSIIKCNECGKDVSDKASVCPNCGNPISIKENIEIKSWYDLNDGEKKMLEEEFQKKTGKSFSGLGTWIIYIFNYFILGIVFSVFLFLILDDAFGIIQIDDDPMFFLFLFISTAIFVMLMSLIQAKKEEKIEQFFNSWLKNTKNIYK